MPLDYVCDGWQVNGEVISSNEAGITESCTIATNIIPYTGGYDFWVYFYYYDGDPTTLEPVDGIPLSNYDVQFFNYNNELLYNCKTNTEGLIVLNNVPPSKALGYFYAKVPGHTDICISIEDDDFSFDNEVDEIGTAFLTQYCNYIIASEDSKHSIFKVTDKLYDKTKASLIKSSNYAFPSMLTFELPDYLHYEFSKATVMNDGSLYINHHNEGDNNFYDTIIYPVSKDGTPAYK